MNKIWPVTVVQSRYGGTYSGGKWLAFNCRYGAVPGEVYGSDIPCAAWFDGLQARWVGRGSTASEAVTDLRSRIKEEEPPEAMQTIWGIDYDPETNEVES